MKYFKYFNKAVKEYGKDSYSVKVSLGEDVTGRHEYQWVSVKSPKRGAEKCLSELIYQHDNGTFIKPSEHENSTFIKPSEHEFGTFIKPRETTMAEYLERWLNDYVRPNLSPSTAKGYESIVRCHLIPALGSISLTQLKPEHLQRYYSEKLEGGRNDGKGGLSRNTVNHHHTCIHCALKTALNWGLIKHNPAYAIPAPRPQQSEIHIMNEDEIDTFLEAAKNTPYYSIFYLALFTGMRRSELLALRWCDVDLVLCQAYVTRSLHHLRNGEIVFRVPKTAKGKRIVALSPSVVMMLKEYREIQLVRRAKLGINLKVDDLIFGDVKGNPLLPDTVSHAWAKLVRSIGLEGIRLHDARHTHASLMLKQGVHPKIVQERLGHATISTTRNLYSINHASHGVQKAAAESFDNLIKNKDTMLQPL